jgi:glycosyltransferase involved in cell wall biosynthesis
MKILLIHQNFPGQFRHLGPELVRKGHDVTAFVLKSTTPYVWEGIKVIPYTLQRNTSPSIHPWVVDFETKVIRAEACFRLAKSLMDQGYVPDVIISHHGWGESMFLKEVWPQARMAIYCEFYYKSEGADTNFDREFERSDPADVCRLKVKNLTNTIHFEFADAGISPTRWQASTFPEPFRSKISVIHDGIDTQSLVPRPDITIVLPNGQRLSRDDEVITYVARNLEPYRGYHTFMRALPRLLKERPRATFLLVGADGISYGAAPPTNKTWKEFIKDEVSPQISAADWQRVHFLGQIQYDGFIALLQVSRVHIYLTYPFVLSWSLLEAMSIGCAIVASNTAPVTEVIEHGRTGLLVDFFSPDQLADTVIALADNQEQRQQLGQNARLFARTRVDLKTICLPRQVLWVENLRS